MWHTEHGCTSNIADQSNLAESVCNLFSTSMGGVKGALAIDTALYYEYDNTTYDLTVPASIPYSHGFTPVLEDFLPALTGLCLD